MNEDFHITEEGRQKGDEAELMFKNWLDKHNIPYFYIKQDTESFSPALAQIFSGKRPDFMVLVPNFGFIFVDVKNRSLNKNFAEVKTNETPRVSYTESENNKIT